MKLGFLIAWVVGSLAFASDRDSSQVDQHLFDAAKVVVVARVLDGAEGSKYLVVKIKVISVLKAPPDFTAPGEMFISYLSFGPKLPTGISTLYLVPYEPNEKGWELLEEWDPKTKTLQKGYSNHVDHS